MVSSDLAITLVIWILLIGISLAKVTSNDASQDNSLKLLHDDNEIDHANKTYGVIVDCGSSGTRASIFRWDSDLQYDKLINNIDYFRSREGKPISKKITPGLSKLKDDPNLASDYMRPIMDFIVENVPEDELAYTSVYMMGTAGMRLLEPDERHKIQRDLFKDLKPYFNKFADVESSIITGADEGMYQWITVNSKLKKLGNQDRLTTQTYGVIEMGGASIQVTYQLLPGMKNYLTKLLQNEPEALENFQGSIVEPEMSREFESREYHLHSTTFLGFGGNSARDAFADLLLMHYKRNRFIEKRSEHINDLFDRMDNEKSKQRYQRQIKLKDPCLPKGAVQMMKKPMSILSATTKSIGFDIEDNEPTFKLILEGESDYSKCWWYLNGMLSKAKTERLNCKPHEPCSMKLLSTAFVPHKSFKFLGLGDFYYTTKEMMDLDGVYDRKKIVQKTREICGTSYFKLQQRYPGANKHDKNRMLLECFKAVWMDVFLTVGLKMPADNDMFQTIGKIDGDSIEWTLGAALDKSLAIERTAEKVEENSV